MTHELNWYGVIAAVMGLLSTLAALWIIVSVCRFSRLENNSTLSQAIFFVAII